MAGVLVLRAARSVLNAVFSAPDEKEEWKTKQAVFARSYDEVLAALKHQDDKLNRTLTAIAFLTVAGITLFTQLPRLGPSPYFPESRISIASFFFVVFLVSLVLALALALAAIGPATAYPRLGRKRDAPPSSLLFYARIAIDPTWDKRLKASAEELRKQLASDLHGEAQQIARRTRYKVARSRESNAFVQLTILSLSLLGIFSTSRFSLATRWWIAGALLIVLLASPLLDVAQMKSTRFTEGHFAWPAYVLLVVILGLTATGLGLAPYEEQHWSALIYALGAVTASRLAFVTRWFARLVLGGATVGGILVLMIFFVVD